MRSRGVPDFPDPGPGGGLKIPAGSGISPRSPAFQAAQQACRKLLPNGGPHHGAPSESDKLAMLALARCMRRHGLPDFPDPTLSPPPAGSGNVIVRGGLFLALGPGMTPQSPAFAQAAKACGFGLPRGP